MPAFAPFELIVAELAPDAVAVVCRLSAIAMEQNVLFAESACSAREPGLVATASADQVLPLTKPAYPATIMQFALVGVIEVVPLVPDAFRRALGVTSQGVVGSTPT
jgi:hypothetical protein